MSLSLLSPNTAAQASKNVPSVGFYIAAQGEFTANGTTEVAVAYAALTADSIVLFSSKTKAGTSDTCSAYVFSRTNGTGFSIKSIANDLSVYDYVVLQKL